MIAAAQPPVLEVYYSAACAPCRLELPVLAALARNDGTRVRVVLIGDTARARLELERDLPALAAITVAENRPPRAALLAAGDRDAILPFARSLRSDGAVCARWRGILTPARARALLSACPAALTSPRSR